MEKRGPDMQSFQDAGAAADAIIRAAGKRIVLAMPLGLGKPCRLADALVEKALSDSGLELHIFTALALEAPRPDSDLARRFLEPAKERLFGTYPQLRYVQLMRKNALPPNITVNQFFLLAGRWFGNAAAQQNFIAANYTHALDRVLERGVNVVAQLFAEGEGEYSASCNADFLPDLLRLRREGKARFVLAGECHAELPFMDGAALVPEAEMDVLLEDDRSYGLYSAPRRPVSLSDQAIGLHAARLVRDGGSLQIGIGSVGDAVTAALILRHKRNDRFRDLATALPGGGAHALHEDGVFERGLYGASEMFVDGFLHLADSGILTREVEGAVLHAGFFVDCRDFYRRLREMEPAARARFQMMPVSFTNELYGEDEPQKRAARVKAAFVNTAMLATLRGAVVSDSLENGQVVSGVGGQYNFVAQSFALGDARSILAVNAARRSKGRDHSNIVWSYGHTTIPWHLKDIVVTEYGIAELKGKSEADTIAAMLCIADSRFQPELTDQAKSAGKLPRGWSIPEAHRANLPERVETALHAARRDGTLPEFPFGTDFTPVERRLLPALERIKEAGMAARLGLLLRGLAASGDAEALERMGLSRSSGWRDRALAALLSGALAAEKNPRS
jgi:acyl-CoA hydrolase